MSSWALFYYIGGTRLPPQYRGTPASQWQGPAGSPKPRGSARRERADSQIGGGGAFAFGSAHSHAAAAVIKTCQSMALQSGGYPRRTRRWGFGSAGAAPRFSPLGLSTPPCPSAVTQQEGATRLAGPEGPSQVTPQVHATERVGLGGGFGGRGENPWS